MKCIIPIEISDPERNDLAVALAGRPLARKVTGAEIRALVRALLAEHVRAKSDDAREIRAKHASPESDRWREVDRLPAAQRIAVHLVCALIDGDVIAITRAGLPG